MSKTWKAAKCWVWPEGTPGPHVTTRKTGDGVAHVPRAHVTGSGAVYQAEPGYAIPGTRAEIAERARSGMHSFCPHDHAVTGRGWCPDCEPAVRAILAALGLPEGDADA